MALGVKAPGQAQAIRDMFARLAPHYDLGNRVLSLGQDQSWRRYVVRLAQPAKPGLVLDLATGTGDLALALARRGNRVIGLDFCGEMVGRGVLKAERSPWRGKVDFVLGDAIHLPFPSNTFDAVTMGFALRNISELSRSFAEIHRVLKGGGRLVILELYRPTCRLAAVIHGYYLKHWVPVIGRWLSGQSAAYQYLARSIFQFPPAEDIRAPLEAVGLGQIKTFRLALGAAVVHLAIKQSPFKK